MLLTIIYIIAITAEAMTGALSAGRRSMDWFGVVIIACVTALGGGSVRDVLLGHYPLTWVKHPEYLMLTCFAAFITILIAKWMRHLRNIFLVLDSSTVLKSDMFLELVFFLQKHNQLEDVMIQ